MYFRCSTLWSECPGDILCHVFQSLCSLFRGHNQRLEFLGDTVLQLVASDYLFKHFPDHHEGHLSVSNQLLFCDFANGDFVN